MFSPRILFISSWRLEISEWNMSRAKKPLRILGLADLHDRIDMLDRLRGIDADLIVFCGDLHNGGNRETARPAALALAGLGLPVLIVPGCKDSNTVFVILPLCRQRNFVIDQ